MFNSRISLFSYKKNFVTMCMTFIQFIVKLRQEEQERKTAMITVDSPHLKIYE